MFALLVMGIVGCSVYTARLTLRPSTSQESFEEASFKIAEVTARKLAELHNMNEVTGPHDPRYTRPYRTIALFIGPGSKRDVSLSAAVKEDQSEIAFVLVDQGHGAETPYTATLLQDLERQVAEGFPEHTPSLERSSSLANPLAP